MLGMGRSREGRHVAQWLARRADFPGLNTNIAAEYCTKYLGQERTLLVQGEKFKSEKEIFQNITNFI